MSENELNLGEIKKVLIAYRGDYINVHKVLQEFLSWHKSERKKWALRMVGENKKPMGDISDVIMTGYNQAKSEIRKKIEESEC